MGEFDKANSDHVHTLMDRGSQLDDRVLAACRLGADDSVRARAALVAVAQMHDTPAPLASAIGRSLGQISFRRSEELDDLVIAEVSSDAYIAYDDELARLLAASPQVKMRRAS